MGLSRHVIAWTERDAQNNNAPIEVEAGQWIVVDNRIVCRSHTPAIDSNLNEDPDTTGAYAAAKAAFQPYEELKFADPSEGLHYLALAPHGGLIEMETTQQARHLYGLWKDNGYTGVGYWAFNGFYGGPKDHKTDGVRHSTWKSSHITAHEIDDTPEKCIPGGSAIGTADCVRHGQPWKASFPELSKVSDRLYDEAMAFHGFSTSSPRLEGQPEGHEGWCPHEVDQPGSDKPNYNDVCVYIGGLKPIEERRCFLETLLEAFQTAHSGATFTPDQIDGQTIGYTAVIDENCIGDDLGCVREVRIRLARAEDNSLKGVMEHNIVNSFTRTLGIPLGIDATQLGELFDVWFSADGTTSWQAQQGHGVQFEQSKKAREKHWDIVAEAAYKAFDILKNGDPATDCQ